MRFGCCHSLSFCTASATTYELHGSCLVPSFRFYTVLCACSCVFFQLIASFCNLVCSLSSALFNFMRRADDLERAYAAMWDVRLVTSSLQGGGPHATDPASTTNSKGDALPVPEAACQRSLDESPGHFRRCIAGYTPWHIVVYPLSRYVVASGVYPVTATTVEDAVLLDRAAWEVAVGATHLQQGESGVAVAVAWRVLSLWRDSHVPAMFLLGHATASVALSRPPSRWCEDECLRGAVLMHRALAAARSGTGAGISHMDMFPDAEATAAQTLLECSAVMGHESAPLAVQNNSW